MDFRSGINAHVKPWQIVFQGAQHIARTSHSFEDGISKAILYALDHPDVFNDPSYWDTFEKHKSNLPIKKVISWSEQGLRSISRFHRSWDCLLLDLGDCPERFSMFSIGERVSQDILRERILNTSIVELRALGSERTRSKNIIYRNVRALRDIVLTWNEGDNVNYHEKNGYFAWLAVATLALIDGLRSTQHCQSVLGGAQNAYLLAGFEEIFVYIATISRDGLVFE